MRILLCFFILALSSNSMAIDLSEFGVRKNSKLDKQLKFEQTLQTHLSEKLSQFLKPELFKVKVSVKADKKLKRILSSKNVQLGMLGTVVRLKPPRHLKTGTGFVDSISEFKIVLYISESVDGKYADELLKIAKGEITFLPSDIVEAEVKTIAHKTYFFDVFKEYQIFFSAILIAVILGFGMREIVHRIPQNLEVSNSTLSIASPSAMAEIVNYDNHALTTISSGYSMPLFSEDDYFKLPLEVLQSVLQFSSFKDVQEVYTLVSPKYKKLYWSCLPSEIKNLPEADLVKQACVIQDVEKTEGWRTLCNEVYKFAKARPEVLDDMPEDLRSYFEGISYQDDQAS